MSHFFIFNNQILKISDGVLSPPSIHHHAKLLMPNQEGLQ